MVANRGLSKVTYVSWLCYLARQKFMHKLLCCSPHRGGKNFHRELLREILSPQMTRLRLSKFARKAEIGIYLAFPVAQNCYKVRKYPGELLVLFRTLNSCTFRTRAA